MALDLLFCRKGNLYDYLEERKLALKKELETLEPNQLLNASEEDLCRYLVSKYSLESPILHENEIYVRDQREADVDVSQDPMRLIFDRSRPFNIKGTRITIAIPFDGDADLFHYRPTTFTTAPPRGEINKQEVHLIYETVEHDPEKLKQEYGRELDEVKRYLEWVKGNVQGFNDSLEPFTRQNITQRKKKLLDDMGLVGALGIPIKRRDDMSSTYTIPSIRKKPKIEMPQVTKESFKPEPILSEEEYENILEIIYNMALVMERSPQTFSKLEEEEIRNHFLMILNSHYDGQATGETFNYGGKTDILIRVEGRNIFIAECKFWRGEKELLNTINQLLGYTSWRDTKAAVLLFNKNQDFSAVLSKINSVVKSHACYKREHNLRSAKLKNETTFSYILHQPKDANRELILTVMSFDIPK